MKDQRKTKKQLMDELAELRRQVAHLEAHHSKSAPMSGRLDTDSQLMEQASDGIFVADARGRFVDANRSGLRMLGYELDELLRMGMQEIIPKEDQELEPIHFDEYRRGETLVVQRRLRRKDGSMVPVEINTKMLPDGRFFGIVRDITERKKTEQALKQSRDTLQTLLDHLPMGISVLVDGRIVRVNRALASLYGYPIEEYLGKTPADYLNAEEASLAARRMKELSKGGPTDAYEYNCKHADGHLVPVEVTSRLIDLDGESVLLNIHRDLTERKRLETEILEVSAREQTRIGQDLHDGLSQHLAGIAFLGKAMAQKLAAQSSPESATATEIVKLVNQAMAQARHLARGLSPVALEVGGLKAALEELGLNMEQLFDVSCAVRADEVLSARDDVKARHLYYVAQEAVANAIKHGQAKNVEICVADVGDHCVLTVRDDGIGFSEDAVTSAGMGLHIMRYRASMIHASFSIRPAPGGGTVVHLSIA
jgi:PAS domain S-box-containing protein